MPHLPSKPVIPDTQATTAAEKKSVRHNSDPSAVLGDLDRLFAELDTNKDGSLSRAEFGRIHSLVPVSAPATSTGAKPTTTKGGRPDPTPEREDSPRIVPAPGDGKAPAPTTTKGGRPDPTPEKK